MFFQLKLLFNNLLLWAALLCENVIFWIVQQKILVRSAEVTLPQRGDHINWAHLLKLVVPQINVWLDTPKFS